MHLFTVKPIYLQTVIGFSFSGSAHGMQFHDDTFFCV